MSSPAAGQSDLSELYLRAYRHYRDRGFGGWHPFADLPAVGVTTEPGVYVVLRPSARPVSFLAVNPAGSHKGKAPTVEIVMLSAKWVPDTAVVYIGKATSLSERLDAYRRQGAGSKAGHWGGRYVWQCADANEFVVGWKPTTSDPGDVEFDLIAQFQAEHGGRLPFANLNRGRQRSP